MSLPRDFLHQRIQWSDIDTAYVNQIIKLSLLEDLEGAGLQSVPFYQGDITTDSLFICKQTSKVKIVAREPLILSGVYLIDLVLKVYGSSNHEIELIAKDADRISAGQEIAWVTADTQTLLKAERVILNFLQHLSGIATHTAKFVDKLGVSTTRLLDTRKTVPGYRVLEKYAVVCGGGWNHRIGLFDHLMIKDNHWSESGQLQPFKDLVQKAHSNFPDRKIEIEVDSLKQIETALEVRADIILLDNFEDFQIKEAIALVSGRALTEASGGITLERLPTMSNLGLDFISIGALTHQSQWVDIAIDAE